MKQGSRISQRFVVGVAAFLLLSVFASLIFANDEKTIDWQRAKDLPRKEQQGETLTEEEKAYLERAKQERRARAEANRPQDKAVQATETTGLVPITDMAKDLYEGQTGGLYGEGRNTPPESLQAAARNELAKIQPLDAEGHPSKTGKIVLMSLGMSNTTQEFSFFKKL